MSHKNAQKEIDYDSIESLRKAGIEAGGDGFSVINPDPVIMKNALIIEKLLKKAKEINATEKSVA